jgi:hypothetical protein
MSNVKFITENCSSRAKARILSSELKAVDTISNVKIVDNGAQADQRWVVQYEISVSEAVQNDCYDQDELTQADLLLAQGMIEDNQDPELPTLTDDELTAIHDTLENDQVISDNGCFKVEKLDQPLDRNVLSLNRASNTTTSDQPFKGLDHSVATQETRDRSQHGRKFKIASVAVYRKRSKLNK